MKTKVCSQCKQDKPLSEFYQNKKTGGYRQPCKNCMKKNRWNKDHRESDQSIHPIPEL